MTRQLSLLAADVPTPAVADLEGLLCGTGYVVRGSGELADTARISVLVDEPWRVAALERRLDDLGLLAASLPSPTASRPLAISVRTCFDPRLRSVADRWTRGATPVAPEALHLDGPRLWWWLTAAGSPDQGGGGPGLRLRVAPSAPARWTPVGAALAEAGVPGIFLGPRADGPAYRLVGARRLGRLADLVGPPPAGAGPSDWPSTSGRSPVRHPASHLVSPGPERRPIRRTGRNGASAPNVSTEGTAIGPTGEDGTTASGTTASGTTASGTTASGTTASGTTASGTTAPGSTELHGQTDLLGEVAPDQTPTDQTPTDQTLTDQTPTDQTPTDQNLTDQTLTDQTPTDQTPTDQNLTDQTLTDQTPTDSIHPIRQPGQ